MKFTLTILFFLGVALTIFAQNVEHKSRASLPSQPLVLWGLANLESRGSQEITLKYVGEKAVLGPVSGTVAASLQRGGDGKSVVFSGKGWLSGADGISGDVLPADRFSMSVRVKPVKSGGLVKTNRCSIVLHHSGLLLAILPVTDSVGTLYREFPIGLIDFGKWHDLVLRFDHGRLDFIVDGIVRFEDHFTEKLKIMDEDPLLIGAWRVEEPVGAGLPQPAKDWLYERPFQGEIDHVALWDRTLNNHEAAQLCAVDRIRKAEETDVQKTLRAYSDFHKASRTKDTTLTQALGLAMRRFMAFDPQRPTYHLTAPMDGLFDPAGAFYHKGRYHVFSYRNIVGILANSPLAHYVSDDLIHWKDEPIAVWADNRLDERGIWLGNIFYDDNKTPTMIYTALGKKGKIGVLAKSSDDLLSFTDKKAVMPNLVHHDGHTWKDVDTWYSITVKQYWGKLDGKSGDGILLLSSKDLLNWTEVGEIFNVPKHPKPADLNQRDGLAEFPYLLPFGNKHVMMVGTRPVRYWIGTFDKSIPAFIPDEPEGKLLDFLNNFHCFNPSAVDSKGPGEAERRIVMAMNINIMGEARGISWYGAHVLPRVLTLLGNRLVQEPVPEAEILRGKYFHLNSRTIMADKPQVIKPGGGNALEISVEFEPGSSKRFGLLVRDSSGKRVDTRIEYDVEHDEIRVSGGLKITSPYPEIGQARAYLQKGQPVKFRVFLDHSLMELFVNGQAGNAVFDRPADELEIGLFSEEGEAKLTSLDAWEMKAAFKK